LLGVGLHIGGRDGRNGGREGAQVEVGGVVGVEGVDVDSPPVDVSHGGRFALSIGVDGVVRWALVAEGGKIGAW
jgi:hypothetical protein